MTDLFAQRDVLERVAMRDADVRLLRHLELGKPPAELLLRLIDETSWRQDHVTVWGKRHLQPRLTAWFGDPGRSYTYSGVTMQPGEWTPLLREIKEAVETASGSAFNSVLLNYYRDHRDSMGFHSDDEPELGPRPTIASLSLGETRTLVFKHKRADAPDVKLRLPSGSLLVMTGETQANWKHGIAKETRPCGPRVNLTFRSIEAGRKG